METAVLISEPGLVQIAAIDAASVKDYRDNNFKFPIVFAVCDNKFYVL